MTASYVAMSVSFCLPHAVAVSAFNMCRCVCSCTERDGVHVCAVCEFWI